MISCVFFLGLFLPGKLSARPRCHGFPKFPQGQVRHQRHQPLPRWGEEAPQTLWVEDGVLHKEDLKGPVKEGSTKARLEEVEQEVFKYKKMIERGVEANVDIIVELKALQLKEIKEVRTSMAALETKVFELQGQIYNLHNQNYEYELKFLQMSTTSSCRILETEESCMDGGPMTWKLVAKEHNKSSKKD